MAMPRRRRSAIESDNASGIRRMCLSNPSAALSPAAFLTCSANTGPYSIQWPSPSMTGWVSWERTFSGCHSLCALMLSPPPKWSGILRLSLSKRQRRLPCEDEPCVSRSQDFHLGGTEVTESLRGAEGRSNLRAILRSSQRDRFGAPRNDARRGRNTMQVDYVIVGAGSAGCVLANRLSEDPGTRVVLLEAGGRDWNPLIHIPAGYIKLMDHPRLTWGFMAEPDPGTNGRAILYPRGRVLGGSSSINGMIYVRGQPEDFDHWGQLGNRGWSWDDVLPFFKKAENWEGAEDAVHGKGGPLFTSHGRDKPLLCRAAVEAGRQLGCEYRDDVNDLPAGAGDGVGWVQQTRGGRLRASAARSYLRPALKRPNLQVITGGLVHRVIFDGRRAVG